MDETFLRRIVALAAPRKIHVLCDEVYRGINHEGEAITASIFDLYERGISTSSMSKAFSLAGLRIGWVCADEEIIERINRRRDYNIISCGRIDDYLAAVALENKEKIIARNLKIVRDNKEILKAWVKKEPLITFVEPRAGTTAFLKYHLDMPSEALCKELLDRKGVMLLPWSAKDLECYVRIG
jgi:aspartate/methionine/tyrosine aminotransferase